MTLKIRKRIRPLTPWTGGKYKIANEIIDIILEECPIHYSEIKNVISPTCGMLGWDLEFNRRAGINPVCSDQNKWLINSFIQIQKHPLKIYKLLENLNQEWKNKKSKPSKKKWYYNLRDTFNSYELSKEEEAAFFIALVKTGYNGLMQINKNGELTTAFGFGAVKNIVNEQHFFEFAKTIKPWKFKKRKLMKALIDVKPGSLVYIDPLYKSSKEMYSKDKNSAQFTEKILPDFTEKALTKGAVMIAISNSYDPKFWKKLFPKSKIFELERQQGSHRDVVAKGRYDVKENLIILK